MDEKLLLDMLGHEHPLFRLKYGLELLELEMRERIKEYHANELLISGAACASPKKGEQK